MMITIQDRTIGEGAPTLVVAEVAQAHDGDIDVAHAYIDAAAESGADAVKFQTHIAAEESTPDEPWRVKFSVRDATRYAYWKRMEFPEADWRALADHARARGLIFLSSPFSVAAVDLLERLHLPAWKLGAGEVTTPDLMDRILETGKPVLLSNGMCTWAELDTIVEILRVRQTPFAVYQCTTAYPCPPEQIGLNVLEDLRTRYGCPVGLSDHSGTIYAGLAAVALGADLLEVHIKLTEADRGPDAPASLTPGQLTQLVEGVRFIETARTHTVDKDAMAEALGTLRQTFRKKIVARIPLEAGHVVAREEVALKKAGPGLGADELRRVIGQKLKRAVQADRALQEDDFE